MHFLRHGLLPCRCFFMCCLHSSMCEDDAPGRLACRWDSETRSCILSGQEGTICCSANCVNFLLVRCALVSVHLSKLGGLLTVPCLPF